jgi:Flp pilus assembly protein TadG
LGPRIRNIAKRLKQRRNDDERGAELIEFAFVVVLLITLLYGIVTFGLILAAQSTITQAAADAARAGLVATSSAVTTAESQAGTDLGWLNKGTCGTSGTTITCVASEAPCASNSAIQCLTVTVTYNYNSSPLFPQLPGLGLVTPSKISSTNVVQMASAS